MCIQAHKSKSRFFVSLCSNEDTLEPLNGHLSALIDSSHGLSNTGSTFAELSELVSPTEDISSCNEQENRIVGLPNRNERILPSTTDAG